MQEDPKLLQQEEATYAEPILVPTVNKTMTLTPSNIVQHQQQQQQASNTLNLGGGGGGYSSTSPKATLRKVINNHNNTATSSNVGALFETSPSPCPSNGLYAPYSDHGNNMAAVSSSSAAANAFSRDPYSSFRSRDAYGAGSMRGPQHPMAYAQQPMDPAPYGTLRSSNKATNLGDGYGTARSVKKVYL